MPKTLEEFVARLHTDGVETGRAEAERLVEEARQEAESLRQGAEAAAREIVARAEAEATARRERVEAELVLAARDTLLALREALVQSLEAILRRSSAPVLEDPAVVEELLSLLVSEYARADAAGDRHIEIHVPDALLERMRVWSLEELSRSLAGTGLEVDVLGGLEEAGFEYQIHGAGVEMTVGALVKSLRELVRPALWHVLDESAAGIERDASSSARLPVGIR